MAKQGISTGSSPNDGTGDTLLAGAEKINENFDEIYTLAGDGTNLAPGIVTAIAAGSNISISTSFGQVTVTALETTGISSYWNLNSTGINTVGRNVGIGTTTAVAGLTVLGGGRISGFLTVTDGLVVSAGSKITGETSIIGGLQATGITTFTSNSVNAVQFNVSGVSTFASSKTATGFTTNTTNTNLNVTGVGTIATLGVTNLSATTVTATNYVRSNNAIVTGVTTVSTGFGTNVTNTNLTVTGISTFASSKTATGFTTNTTNTNLRVTGVGTFVGLCTAGEYGGPTGGRWQVGASGTAHYTFTGPGFGGTVTSDPTLYLARGQTYYFNNTSTAQLRIQSGANGSVSSQWNVGVTNNDADQNVQLEFEVPYSAPNTLYYQATNFNTMGGSIVIYPSI